MQAVNKANASPPVRKVMEKRAGRRRGRVAAAVCRAALPRRQRRASLSWPVRDGARTPGKVAIFATCYVNYNEPGIGHDLLKILEHNAGSVRARRERSVLRHAEARARRPRERRGAEGRNIPVLAPLAREGYAILTPVPSCTLMFKQELPLLFPEDADVLAVRDAMFDPFEYFVARERDGLLDRTFTRALGKVSYHIPCHARVQNIGQKTREVLEWVPGTTVNTVERCAGHDGTWGVKREFFADSMKIGRPVFRRMAECEPDYVSSDCPIAGRRIEQGIEQGGSDRQRAQGASADAAAHRLRNRLTRVRTTMPRVTRDSLMTLEAYAKERAEFRARVLAHKSARTVHLGEHVTLLFEDELTIRYQIQEMLRIEKMFEEAGIQDELDAYNPLDPGRQQPQGDDADRVRGRRRAPQALARLKGIEDRVWVRVGELPAVLRDRRRGPRARERAEDLGRAFPALRAHAADDRGASRAAPRSRSASIIRDTARKLHRSPMSDALGACRLTCA